LTRRHVPAVVRVGAIAGLALFVALVVDHGVREIARRLAFAGTGLLWLPVLHLVPLAASALGWRAVLGPTTDLPRRTFLRARWIAESINQLLPALQLGGNLVRAQIIARSGVPGPLAGASLVVDITLHLLAQLVFALLGLGLLLLHLGGRRLAGPVIVGLVVTASIVAAFYAVQRRGVFGTLARMLARMVRSQDWRSLSSSAEAMDTWIGRLYGNRRAIRVSLVWHVLSWVLGASEIWLALRLLRHPVPLATAVVLESLGEAIRTAAFAIPGALGVQEGGFVLLGNVYGFGPELSIALSLTKRVRELCLGIPGLIVWQLEAAVRTGTRRAAVEP
jgi:putative membrane protein